MGRLSQRLLYLISIVRSLADELVGVEKAEVPETRTRFRWWDVEKDFSGAKLMETETFHEPATANSLDVWFTESRAATKRVCFQNARIDDQSQSAWQSHVYVDL